MPKAASFTCAGIAHEHGETAGSMAFYRTSSFLQRERIPVTITIVGANIVLFLADFFTKGLLDPLFGFRAAGALLSPIWSPLTYPLLTPSIIAVLFACWWMWFMGGSLERSWSSQRFGLFFAAITLLTALFVWIGTLVLRQPGELLGLWIPLAALTCAWAAINPREKVIWFVFPMEARWLAILTVVIIYFGGFEDQPLLGLFFLLSPLAAWFYVRSGFSIGGPIFNRRPASRGPDLRFSTTSPPRPESTGSRFSPLAWYRRWQERRHLEKLWRNSGFTDKDDRNRRF